jgi:hypothetical protein
LAERRTDTQPLLDTGEAEQGDQIMKLLALAAGLSLFLFAGNAMAQIHAWPKTDPDPYFQQKDLEKDSKKYPPKYPKKYPQKYSKKYSSKKLK